MKKRVHELAKELKVHGIELDNKELVSELQALGYDVKSHSSSLEDDQASTAVEKIVAKRKPKAAPPPVKAAGFVVRRRPADAPAPAPTAPPAYADGHPAAPAPAHHEPAQPVEVAPPVQPAPAQPAAEAHPEVAPQVTPPSQPVAAQPAEQPAPAPAVPPSAPPAPAAPRPTATQAVVVSRPAVAVPPTVRSGQPSQQPMAARPGQSPTATPPPPSGAATSRPAQAGGPVVDVRRGPMNTTQMVTQDANKRPTATQAVVVSRPLIPIKRVTPPSSAVKNIPMAPGPRGITPGPGQRRIGPITDLQVVRGPGGAPDSFVDQSKDKAQPGNKRKKTEMSENLSKQEILDIARGRTTLPLRGKKKKPTKKGNKTQITQMSADKKVIEIEEAISVSDLSQRLGVRAGELIKKLMGMGQMATVNQMLDVDTAELLAGEYGWKIEKVGFDVSEHISEAEDKAEDLRPRPPVVTVMGHVDHGKTSLLDAIRKANVAEGEAGGITQHIGAYSVNTSKGPITFLDTPGHEAFTAMRARGAKVTDLVILVVAADDGVMPQTVEAINHAKAAEVPIIVAINKIDKPGADLQKTKNALMGHELVPEEFGGDTLMVPVSAKNKTGIDDLLENIALQAEVLELKANPAKQAIGAIVEAKLDKGRGPVATVLIQDGTLKLGDAIVSGVVSGKVRAMMNERGDHVEEVGPGFPVEVLGLSGVPTAGDDFNVVEDDKVAKEIADHRADVERKKLAAVTSKSKLEDLFSKIEKGQAKELKVIVKADTQGSAEAVANALLKLSTPKVKVNVLRKAVGGISESDVMLASASDAIIVGFNTKAESNAENIASQQGVQIKMYDIIYTAVDEVKLAMEGLLEPIRREKPLGKAEVRQVFNLPKQGAIAGCAVLDGKITRQSMLRVLRAGKVVHSGKVKSLRRIKEDVREVAAPLECGVGIDGYNEFQPGDMLEAFEIEEIRQSL